MESKEKLRGDASWIAADQRRRWLAGERRPVEDYLRDSPAISRDSEAVQDLIYQEFRLREQLGERPDSDEYCRRFPTLSDALRKLFEVHAAFPSSIKSGTMHAAPEESATRISPDDSRAEDNETPRSRSDETFRHRIGRYEVRRQIGQGGYGRVYLAYDAELDRDVAIKSPRRERFRSDADVALFVAEARAAAKLNHPTIVAVYDVGRTSDGAIFVVMEYVPGQSLLDEVAAGKLAPVRVAEIVAAVAHGLQHAHEQGLVHRDLKPANILLDAAGRPHIADFGLAVNERQRRERAGEIAGTPAYMSPEQVRGETHRLDGRTDLWSLGVIMYELLCQRRPFVGGQQQLYDEILHREPTALRQMAPDAPPELERICHRCLAKRVSARYDSADELAAELRRWLGTDEAQRPSTASKHEPAALLMPKGLLSFSAADAVAFLALLPGPRDHRGWPETLRYWVQRIERFDAGQAFSVGVLYGPTGCGKSSFVSAGLLPRLSEQVVSVTLNCDAERQTEQRLLERLRFACPALRPGQSLEGAVRSLREEAALPPGKKVLIVLDQFEQWLHGRSSRHDESLVDALRQCDGAQVQCLLLVRDDFWMPLTRFMRELEIPPVEGENCGALDLLPAAHARNVLREFGVALERLPRPSDRALAPAQERFLDLAIEELSEDGAVSPARLALFVEMMRTRDWEPATLRSTGGARGLGAYYLEETFASPSASPARRRHASAAAAVLGALLPESAAELKGTPRSADTLRERSGYGRQTADFDELMSLLQLELRLVTSSVPDDATGDSNEPHYQLAHDFLVPALRDWLSRRQRETARGRAELRLEELAQIWTLKPERRRLPSAWEWTNIRRHVPKRLWTSTQSRMMREAGRQHLKRGGAAFVVVLLAAWGWMQARANNRVRTQVEKLLVSETAGTPAIIAELSQYGQRGARQLRAALDVETPLTKTQERNLRLALLPFEPTLNSEVQSWLDDSEPQDAGAIAEALVSTNPQFLRVAADRAISGSEAHFLAFMPVLRRRPEAAVKELMSIGKSLEFATAEAVASANSAIPMQPEADATAAARDLLQRKQALASIALCQLGRPQFVLAAMGNVQDSALRSYCINLSAPLGTSPTVFVEPFTNEQNVARRRSMLLLLGSYDAAVLQRELPVEQYAALVGLVRASTADTDAGLHAAATWALERWSESLPSIVPVRAARTAKPSKRDWPGWEVSPAGMELVTILGPTRFVVGDSDNWEADVEKATLDESFSRELPYSFAIGAREVTRAQFQGFHRGGKTLSAVELVQPVVHIDWHDAAEFCNWLSEKEGMPPEEWCYREVDERDESTPEVAEVAEVEIKRSTWMIPESDWQQRRGYRLPTELEWECACRAGTRASRFFGRPDDLLPHYSWYAMSSPIEGTARIHPVGQLKPNDWGLFDVFGNAIEWCHEPMSSDNVAPGWRVVRGGSFGDFPIALTADVGEASPAEYRTFTTGFRVARTILTKRMENPVP